MTPAVACEALQKTYRLGFWAKKVHALRGVGFTLEPGEVLGLIGPNGAGKSTTIKILLNLVFADTGSARIFGIDVRTPQSRHGVGYVPEAPTPYEYLTGEEYLGFQSRLAGLSPTERAREVDRVLDRVNMTQARHLQIRRYSKGMTQRIMLAGALLGRPRLLILDEPTSGLDPFGRRLVQDLILEQRRAGVAVLFCTHIISDIETLCDRVALLVNGQIRREGTVDSFAAGRPAQHELVVETPPGTTSLRDRLAPHVTRIELLGQRAIITVTDIALDEVLKAVWSERCRIIRLQPVQSPIEGTFLELASAESRSATGGLE